MRNFRWLLLLALLVSCTDEPSRKAESSIRSQVSLCKAGGAAFNAATSECMCPEGKSWNGTKCDSGVTALTPEPPPQALTDDSDSTADEASEHDTEATAVPPAPPKLSPAKGDDRLEKVCSAAHAKWLADDHYCACPKAKVLVGPTCRKLAGRMIDDVCLRAVHPGKWLQGVCECPDNHIFNPGRGGCVLPVLAATPSLQDSCENSLNAGRWDQAKVRCNCPKLRVWVDELCQVQQLLASQDICEGAFNKGKWDLSAKRCRCPAGTLWFNQSCQPLSGFSPKRACQDEANAGRWNQARRSCRCPGKRIWHSGELSCR